MKPFPCLATIFPFLVLLALTAIVEADDAKTQSDNKRLRVIVTSDFPPIGVVKGGNVPNTMKSDPDDMQSMVRFLLYANEFDIEGLVASAGTFAMEAHKKNILGVIDQYEKVYDNLKKHDLRYPSADYLRSVTFEGKGNNHRHKRLIYCVSGVETPSHSNFQNQQINIFLLEIAKRHSGNYFKFSGMCIPF